jgi:serine/threonine-protein kinase
MRAGQAPASDTVIAVGSPPYMSPEQIRAAPNIDARTDIWSLGCVLHELLSGRAPFDAPSLMQVCSVVLERDPLPLRKLDPATPAGLEAVVTRCLQKDPSKRFQDVGELAVALCPFAPERARVAAERCCHVLGRTAVLAPQAAIAQPVAEPPPAESSVETPSKPASEPTRAPAPAVTAEEATVDVPAERRSSRRPRIPLLVGSLLGAVLLVLGLWGQQYVVKPTPSEARARAIAPYPGMQSPSATSLGTLSPKPSANAAAPADEASTGVAPAAAVVVQEELNAASAPLEPAGPRIAGLIKARRRAAGVKVIARRARDTSAKNELSHASPSAPAPPVEAPAPTGPTPEERAAEAKPAAPPVIAITPVAPVASEVPAKRPAPAAAASPRAAAAPAPGTVEQHEVAATVLSHASEVQGCFERAQMEHAELHGHILLRATLDSAGNVTSSSTTDVFQGGARLAACIASAARHWKFPPPSGDTSGSISYRFVFD